MAWEVIDGAFAEKGVVNRADCANGRGLLLLSCCLFFCHSEQSEESTKGNVQQRMLHFISLRFSMRKRDVMPSRAKNPDVFVL